MNLYFKYNLYHWRTLLTGLLFSIIFGPVALTLIWLLITVTFLYDYHSAVKELEVEKRHHEILRAVNSLGRNENNNSIYKEPIIKRKI